MLYYVCILETVCNFENRWWKVGFRQIQRNEISVDISLTSQSTNTHIMKELFDHSKKSDRGFGDSHPCVVRCLCQGVLVQCRVAHRYPPGSSFPIEFCVMCEACPLEWPMCGFLGADLLGQILWLGSDWSAF